MAKVSDKFKYSNRTHGLYKHGLYKRWLMLKQRCSNPNYSAYKYYGGRGIKVWDGWKNDFKIFYDYMMALPNAMDEGFTIDRIDNNGNYEPGNIRWADRHTQLANTGINNKNKSGYKGVWENKKHKFHSSVKCRGEKKHIGSFKTIEEAALSRDLYIIKNKLYEYPLQVFIYLNFTPVSEKTNKLVWNNYYEIYNAINFGKL